MIHQMFSLTVESPQIGAQPPDCREKPIDGNVVLQNILIHGMMTWDDFVKFHSVYVTESVKRYETRIEIQDTPMQRLRGDSFTGGTIAVQQRRAKHKLWKDAMKTAQLLNLSREVARCHGWLYCRDEVGAPGALPPGGVEGTYLDGRCCGFIWPKMVHGKRTADLKYCSSCFKYDGVKRWLCIGCRDNRDRSTPDVAHCMPGYCPAFARQFDANWHTAELNRPQWFQQWAGPGMRGEDFEHWTTPERETQLNYWYRDFFKCRLTQALSDAEQISNSALDPFRNRNTHLPDATSFSNRIHQVRH